jgi:hypothetical protein
MTLYDGDRTVGPPPDGLEADFLDLSRKRIGADNEHRRSWLQLLLQQPCGALSTGHDVVGFGRKTHLTQVRGDFGRSAGGVVRDEQHAGADCSQGFYGARSGFISAEDRAVEIEE